MKKKIVFLSMLAMILALSLVFTACDDGDDTHTHSYGNWTWDATRHWKECSCGAKIEIANHTDNPCTVCGYTSGGSGVFKPTGIWANTSGVLINTFSCDTTNSTLPGFSGAATMYNQTDSCGFTLTRGSLFHLPVLQ